MLPPRMVDMQAKTKPIMTARTGTVGFGDIFYGQLKISALIFHAGINDFQEFLYI